MYKTQFWWFIFCIYLYGIPSAGYSHAQDMQKRYEFNSQHMGTRWQIVLYSADETGAKAAAEAAFARVAELEKVLSDYDAKSEVRLLCKVNDAASGEPITISTDLEDTLAKSLKISTASDGAFDVTVGPLMAQWREMRRTRRLTSSDTIAKTQELVGYNKLTLDTSKHTLTLAKAGMRLDFGGIGKGYAADAALKVLKEHGCPRALVAASGDITVGDAPPDREAWLVEIAPLTKDEPKRQLNLVNASVSTSGDLFQFIELEGVRYSHVLNPKTGLGQTGRRSATVVAPHGWLADGLTKAALLMPTKQAIKVIEQFQGSVTLVVKENDDAKPVVTESKSFATYLAK